MILDRTLPFLSLLLACEDRALRHALSVCFETASAPLPGASGLHAIWHSSTEEPADALLVEVGGNVGLDHFRAYRDQFPATPIVVCAAREDAELAEVATDHGADDILYREEISYGMLCRVVGFACERNALIRQLSSAREREAQLATHDSVTGLANRSLTFTCITQAVALAKRQSTGIAVVALDICDLAKINDSFGFRAGDKVLAAVGERLTNVIGANDVAGRLGGSEFTLMLRDHQSRKTAGQMMKEVLGEVTRPLFIAGHRLNINARAGSALCPIDGDDTETLVTLAHAALETARTKGCAYVNSRASHAA